MASGRELQIRAERRNRRLQMQQVNRLYAARLRTGDFTQAQAATQAYTADEIAGLMGYRAPTNTTVRDGDTLETIASANATTVPDLLNANPQMTAPQTGMVINLPRPARFAMKNDKRDLGGIGLPSNAAFGNLATNNGNNPYQLEKQQTPADIARDIETQAVNASRLNRNRAVTNFLFNRAPSNPMVQLAVSRAANRDTPNLPSWMQQAANRASNRTVFQQYNGSIAGGSTIAEMAQLYNANYIPETPIQPTAATIAQQAVQNVAQPRRSFSHQRENMVTLLDSYVRQIEAGAVPNEFQLKLLERSGRIVRDTPTPAYAAGPSRPGRGRGGRGGRGRGGGGGYSPRQVQQGERLPAFSTGGGFRGLVSWRI